MAAEHFAQFYCQVCTSVLKDRNVSVFTNCGHLVCCACHKTPDICPICNAHAEILPIAKVSQLAPHLEGLFLGFKAQKDRFKRQFLKSQAKAFEEIFEQNCLVAEVNESFCCTAVLMRLLCGQPERNLKSPQ